MSVTRYQFKVGGKHWVLATDYDEEIARLKAEVERLKEDKQQLEARLDFLENPRS